MAKLCELLEVTISTHTPLARRDSLAALPFAVSLNFYSHASCEARRDPFGYADRSEDFYSHASCEARPSESPDSAAAAPFLLTRLLRGATSGITFTIVMDQHFYSHASCEARLVRLFPHPGILIFLLTRPMRGATQLLCPPKSTKRFLLTRPMRGATRKNIL